MATANAHESSNSQKVQCCINIEGSTGYVKISKESDGNLTEDEDENRVPEITPQRIIRSLPHYTVRPKGAYLQPNCFCGICNCKYNIGDKVICLPCQHNFHKYCIENWLKWVKSTCPVDKKSIIRSQFKDDMLNERRNRLLKIFSLNDTVAGGSSSDENNSGIEIKAADRRTCKNTSKNKMEVQSSDDEISGDNTLSTISHLGLEQTSTVNVTASPPQQHFQKFTLPTEKYTGGLNTKDEGHVRTSWNKNIHQFQKSSDTLRKRSNAINFNQKCTKNFLKFQKALKKVSNDLSEIKIQSSKGTGPNYPKKYCSNFEALMKTFSSTTTGKEDKFNSGTTAGKRITFADLLDEESDVSPGWSYKGNLTNSSLKTLRMRRSPNLMKKL